MTINSIKLGSDVKLTPEMENVLFGKKAQKAQKEQYVISSAKVDENVKLTPEMENVLFRKSNPKEAFNLQDLDKRLQRNIFSPELTKPTKYKINNIVMEDSFTSLSFPIAASFSPALVYNVPEQKQDNKLTSIEIPSIDSIIKSIQDPINIPKIDSTNIPKIDSTNIPIIDSINIPIIDPINPDPFIPKIDPINPVNPINPDPFIPNIDPLIITNKIVFPGGGDFDLLGPQEKGRKGKRKTKNKMAKNVYGDPFKIKL
jgi:hypothetical protein